MNSNIAPFMMLIQKKSRSFHALQIFLDENFERNYERICARLISQLPQGL